MKAGVAILALCASIVATAAPVLATPYLNASVNACLQPSGDVETIVSALASAGWSPIPAGEPASDVIEQLIWPQTVAYFTTDTGGEALTAVLDLQRKTVRGFARKKDIPQSKTRILTRIAGDQLETVLVSWRQPAPRQTETTCRFAFSTATVAGNPAAAFDPQPQINLSEGAVQRSIAVVLLDQSGLAATSGAPVTVSATIETTLSFPSKE